MSASILCADDDRSLCKILSRALSTEGYEVRLAHDGEEALRSIRAAPPDLLLIDVMLPKQDGFQVLEALRREAGELADLPAVAISGGAGTPRYQERARQLGVHTLLAKPVPLDLLMTTIHNALAEALADASPAEKKRGEPRAAEQILSGTLDELPFPALLHHLHGLRAQGVLELRAGRRRKWLELQAGLPAAVRSNLMSECLGHQLLKNGRITHKDLSESVRRMRREGGLQGEVLLGMEVLSEEDLAHALRAQAEEKLFEVFSWVSGEFRFRRGAQLARANALTLDSSAANLILTGVRERMPLERVDAALTAYGEGCVCPGESPFYRFQEVDLDVAGSTLFRDLERRPQLSDLLVRDDATRRTLYALLATGLVEVGGERSPDVSQAAGCPDSPRRVAEPPLPADDPEAGVRSELAALAERLRGRDYFDMLGVDQRASPEDVRRAYVDAAKRTHPDRFRSASEGVRRLAEEVFGLLSTAYNAISDPKRRQAYVLRTHNETREAAELEEGRRALQAELRFREGERLLRGRHYQGALACFEEAAEMYPDEGEYHAYRGFCLYLARPRDPEAEHEALQHLRRGRKLAPACEKPYLFMGRLHRSAGRIAKAEECFSRALELSPECVEAMRELRLIRMRREKAEGLVSRLSRRFRR